MIFLIDKDDLWLVVCGFFGIHLAVCHDNYMVAAIRSAGLPARVSNTAGLFVCNQVMYGVLYHLAHELPHTLGGFMHVPYAPEQAARQSAPQPSMSKDDIARAISAAIGAIERHLAARR